MPATLTLTISRDVRRAMRKGAVKLALVSEANGRAAPARGPRRRAGRREGTHPARILAWASGRAKPFGVADVMKALGLKRPHASMVLTRLVRSRAVRREGRGVYRAS